ncbi:MAG: sigma-70 family RNA polymerase sigma factor [Bryobacteraceae bacterium]
MAVPWMGHFMLEQTLLRQTITQARAGDEAAFERIVILHEQMVLRTAQRLLLNNEAAKDAAQEVFLRLHRNLHQLRDGKDLVPWLYRITVNICLDAKRRSKPVVCLDSLPEAADRSLNPEQALSRAQHRALIVSALRELSKKSERQLCFGTWRDARPAMLRRSLDPPK